jgi:hypothetical protein
MRIMLISRAGALLRALRVSRGGDCAAPRVAVVALSGPSHVGPGARPRREQATRVGPASARARGHAGSLVTPAAFATRVAVGALAVDAEEPEAAAGANDLSASQLRSVTAAEASGRRLSNIAF